jgi:hypothetical protein
MADTPWDGFTDVTALEATDIMLAMRGAGGINFPVMAFVYKSSADNRFKAGAGLDVTGTGTFSGIVAVGKLVPYTGHLVLDGNAGGNNVRLQTQGTTRAEVSDSGVSVTGTGSFSGLLTLTAGQRNTGGTLWRDESTGAGRPSNSGLGFEIAGDAGGTDTYSVIQSYNPGAGTWGQLHLRGVQVQLRPNDTLVAYATTAGFLAGGDNAYTLGGASSRWSTVYAGTGTINTSDATEKTLRGDGGPTEQEIAWARSIRAVCYQLNDAIAEKGEAARLHWGVFAQQVYAAGIEAGIEEPFHYGFVGRDPKTRIEKQLVQGEREKLELVTETVSEIEMRDGRAVLVPREVEREQVVFDEFPIEDEAGKPVMIATGEASDVLGPDGQPVPKMVQAMHRVPVMETFEVEQEVEVPVLGEDGEPEYRWNVRYTELVMFMLACGALGQAVP